VYTYHIAYVHTSQPSLIKSAKDNIRRWLAAAVLAVSNYAKSLERNFADSPLKTVLNKHCTDIIFVEEGKWTYRACGRSRVHAIAGSSSLLAGSLLVMLTIKIAFVPPRITIALRPVLTLVIRSVSVWKTALAGLTANLSSCCAHSVNKNLKFNSKIK
jgi:hypothetical protein